MATTGDVECMRLQIKHKHLRVQKNQLCAATAYYYYGAYLLKVGLILYCGMVCSYITWNGINKTEGEKFSHTVEDQKVGRDV